MTHEPGRGPTALAGKRSALHLRARILQAIRAFFVERGFLEVETPVRIPAPAPEEHIDAVPSGSWWLQTSPELCMKRLLAAGYPRVFQLARCFREGERGRWHLPEFTLLEWYRAGVDYGALMEDCEALLAAVAEAVGGVTPAGREGRPVSLAAPWPRLTVEEAFRRFAGLSAAAALDAGRFDELLVERVEPELARLATPVFLVDYPARLAALARRKPDREEVAERFELYAGGLELANAFSELTDPAEQRARFAAERARRRAQGRPDYPWPEPFLRDLAHLPPSAGIALGVDRLVGLYAGARRIDEVVAFAPEDL
ncbi:MAG: EF-P lysine aminoacylase EpmA [Deferrisomatales bacterium]